MAFLKKAKAMVVHPRISGRGWGGVRKTASSGPTANLTDQARGILGGSLDPDKYLFTHCTIVASVDTESVPDVRLGKVKVGSTTVDRRFADYHIKPECSQYVNNNGDSWSRNVLLASYPTFIGAHNFLEHVQIEEKSKGRIIDAVARDIGDSVYVDILVATNRKHASLIQDIESGKMSTLSMGCTTDFTICTKCGHYAVDETDLCEHIRYNKLNTFMDDHGQKRVIAELCGHVDYADNADAPGGVRFIEASWVAVPAFPGAVMRNILKTEEVGAADTEIRRLLASSAPNWSETAIKKAATLSVPSADFTRKAFDFGGGDEGGGEEEAPAEPEDPFKNLEDSVFNMVLDKVKTRLEESVSKQNTEKAIEDEKPSDWANDTIIKEGSARKAAAARYASALETLVRVAASDVALVDGIAAVNQSYDVQVPVEVYRAALSAGGLRRHASPSDFVQACRKQLGRNLRSAELRVVVRVGTLLSRWESNNNPK